MPRKVAPPTAIAPAPPPPLSPIIQRLRQDWRWAGISQFIHTFSDAFGLSDWDIETLEKDFDGTEQAVIPELIAKLLYALTWNRQINRENVFEHLVTQYEKRAPDNLVMGTKEEPLAWETLGLDQKVQILWQLCEWQLSDPARFRSLLTSEADAPSWRVDPIGWDKAGNTYFLFDDNRLWVQRAPPLPPRPPKKTSQKAKRARAKAPAKRTQKRKAEAKPRPVTPPPLKVDDSEPVSGRRKRRQVVFYGNVTPTVDALKRGTKAKDSPPSSRATRASARSAANTPSKSAPAPPLPRGTRVSRRLHAVDDEWQQIPQEWLSGDSKAKEKADDHPDDESELSDLPDEESGANSDDNKECVTTKNEPDAGHSSDSALSEIPSAGEVTGSVDEQELPQEDSDGDTRQADEADEDEDEIDEFEQGLKEARDLPEGFIEWEAVCVSLYDWRTFPEHFANSRHPDEKAFYKLLSTEVAPQIIEVLEIKEQERLKQEAINNRKRSSRIAMRELEREERQKQEQAQREMEERMEKLRQEEARKEREEQEALAKERAREERLREREERLAARERAIHERAESEARQREQAERAREKRKRRREGEEVSDDEETAPPSRAATAAASDGQGSWELKCEVCKLHGWNLNDETDVVCCDDCGRWQHMPCHDRQDKAAGRKPRDWDSVDFRCQECESRANAAKRPTEGQVDGAAPSRQDGPSTANGHTALPTTAPPSSNGPHHADPHRAERPAVQPQHILNGHQDSRRGPPMIGAHQTVQYPHGHGVPISSAHLGHVRHDGGAQHYLPPPPVQSLQPSGYNPAAYQHHPAPPPTHRTPIHEQPYPNGGANLIQGPAPYYDGRPHPPRHPHEAPAPLYVQHRFSHYGGAPYPAAPTHNAQQFPPDQLRPRDTLSQVPHHAAQSSDRRLCSDGRPA